MNSNLVEPIAERVAKGVPVDEIKHEVIALGYTAKEFDTAYAQATGGTVESSSPATITQNSRSNLFVLVGIVLTLLLTAGGIFAYKSLHKETNANETLGQQEATKQTAEQNTLTEKNEEPTATTTPIEQKMTSTTTEERATVATKNSIETAQESTSTQVQTETEAPQYAAVSTDWYTPTGEQCGSWECFMQNVSNAEPAVFETKQVVQWQESVWLQVPIILYFKKVVLPGSGNNSDEAMPLYLYSGYVDEKNITTVVPDKIQEILDTGVYIDADGTKKELTEEDVAMYWEEVNSITEEGFENIYGSTAWGGETFANEFYCYTGASTKKFSEWLLDGIRYFPSADNTYLQYTLKEEGNTYETALYYAENDADVWESFVSDGDFHDLIEGGTYFGKELCYGSKETDEVRNGTAFNIEVDVTIGPDDFE